MKRALLSAAGKLAICASAAFGVASVAQAQTVQSVAADNTLVTFNASAPGTVVSSVKVTGVAAGTTLGAIDYRPAAGRILYAISNVGQLYAINPRTGVATAVGTAAGPPIGGIAMDFNPTVDRIRVDTQTRMDYRVNPDTGAIAAVDGTLAYAPTDPMANAIVNVAGAAYTNPVASATSTTLYVIDTRGGLAPAQLATQGNATVSPNTGTLYSVGSTGVTTIGNVGFDIGVDGTALATFTNPTTRVTSLYRVNLTTGAATLIGTLAGNKLYEGLAIALDPFATMGATGNQQAVGQQLDMFNGLPSGATLALLNAVDSQYGIAGAQAQALSSLTPGSYSLLPQVALDPLEATELNVLRYTRDLRGSGTMPDGSVATLNEAGTVGAWIIGGQRFGHYDAAVDRPRLKDDEHHVMGGIDYRFGTNAAIGVFAGYGQSDLHLTPLSQQSRLRSRFAGAYATAALGPAYVDLWGTYADQDWRLTRSLTIGSFGATNTGFTDGKTYGGGASTGFSFGLGAIEFEPFAAIRYAKVEIDGFGENGSVTALQVGDRRYESWRSHLGARAGLKIPVGRALVRPQVRGGWYHEFKDDPQVFAANFTGTTLGTASFPFTVTPLRRDYYDAGASLDISGNGPLSMVADFQSQFAKDRRIDTMTIGARLAF